LVDCLNKHYVNLLINCWQKFYEIVIIIFLKVLNVYLLNVSGYNSKLENKMSEITNSFNSAWENAIELTKKEPWRERFQNHIDNYLGTYCSYFRLSEEAFFRKIDKLKNDMSGQLFGVNIETFFEKQFDNAEDNIADAYLK
jgi:hypothetical protein